LWSELAGTVVHVALVLWGTAVCGVAGAGAAFAGLYLFYVVLIYRVVQLRHGYSLRKSTRNIVLAGTLAVVAAFAITFARGATWRFTLGAIMLVIVSILCVHGLLDRLGRERPSTICPMLSSRLELANAGG
jgi:PST family polysaccharide transporter